ncbi:hypothetical protein F7734_46140 [Scytonema sp. UIC 10036]|uniref:hypothetical protein n=1 Tax=Scytonema sp. UIC 10036 TaxID=2304196 RepID=UPI0012DA6351|nr:hypothetical protein [Scytonema sp. UIC 10036]MUG99283.1 hypothetical protein [Scytonema sp. UIC 10036]
MKVTVRDIEIFQNLELEELRNYLQTHGWHEDRSFMNNATIWLKQEIERGEFEILLPNRKNLGDYATRISEATETLAVVENRSQLEIINELITTVPNTTIQGIIMQIEQPVADKLSGEIILLGVVIDKLRKIKTKLNDQSYILALKAYQGRLPILCRGDLIKENNTFILKNPHDFTLDNQIMDT